MVGQRPLKPSIGVRIPVPQLVIKLGMRRVQRVHEPLALRKLIDKFHILFAQRPVERFEVILNLVWVWYSPHTYVPSGKVRDMAQTL
ncbi:MAG: hypothetical protein Greene071421_551, partial [Parcubacteria group bacterium Greene0714_21]